jgi:hypothetical protein
MNWYYLDNLGEVRGPVSEQAVRELKAAGVLSESTQICQQGSQEWTTVDAVFEQDRHVDSSSEGIKFNCCECSQKIVAAAACSGQVMQCPNCKEEISVPFNDQTACPPPLPGSATRSHVAPAGREEPKSPARKTFMGGIGKLPVPLKIGLALAAVFVALMLIAVVGMFVVVGAVNTAASKTDVGQGNQSTHSQPLDPLASMEADFGLKLDRDTAYLYVMGYQYGSKGASAMAELETPQPGFDQLAITALLNSPDLSSAQRKLAEAGVNDGKAGRPNRLEGIDLQSLEPAPIQHPLSYYASTGNIAKVIEMATNRNVNEPDEFSGLPLHRACASGHIEIARHLLSLGARVDLADKGSGHYPIHCAASGGNLDLFILLLKAGARIDQKTDIQESRRDSQMKGILSVGGFNPDEGSQPIHIAAASGSYSICQYLLKNGIGFDTKDNNGLTPRDYAIKEGWISSHAETIRLFDPQGAVESSFRKAVGGDGRSIRTGGIYLRIFENTGEYKVYNGGSWNAHCLEFGEDRSAHFMFWSGEDKHPTAIIRSFRAQSNQDNVYLGSYVLSGEKLDYLSVELRAIPQDRYKTLTGTAHGDKLNLKFMSPEDSLQDRFFPSNSDSEKTRGSEFKFYAECPM